MGNELNEETLVSLGFISRINENQKILESVNAKLRIQLWKSLFPLHPDSLQWNVGIGKEKKALQTVEDLQQHIRESQIKR